MGVSPPKREGELNSSCRSSCAQTEFQSDVSVSFIEYVGLFCHVYTSLLSYILQIQVVALPVQPNMST